MLSKTLGSVMNIREGPACKVSGSPPENANTAGMIISIVWMVLAFVIGIAVGCAAANAVTNPDYYYYYTTY